MQQATFISAALAVLLCPSGLVQATPIKYSEQAVASGTLGTIAFSHAWVTITGFGDNLGVSCSGPSGHQHCSDQLGPTIVTVGDLLATFIDNQMVFLNQEVGLIGIGPNDQTPILGTIQDDTPLFYDLRGNYQLTDRSSIFGQQAYPTTRGPFTWHLAPFEESSTFTATVPEPLSITLLGFAAAAMMARTWARKHMA